MTAPIDWSLVRAPSGRLAFKTAAGDVFDDVVPVRCFPITAPDDGFSIVTTEGRELAWIARLADLPADLRALLQEALDAREFLPEIRRLRQVSTFATPSTWWVETDRGDTTFVLAGEDDIRRMSASMLLVSDANGVQYLVRDHRALDRASRKLLDRFL
jgi:hypothetical protein